MKRYIFLLVAFLLSGCSPESSFLQSMNGKWPQDKQAFNLYSVDGKLVMLDDTGTIVLLTPSGNFDSANKLMPVKAIFYTQYKSTPAVKYEVAKLACPEAVQLAATMQMNPIFASSLLNDCLSKLDEKMLLEKLEAAKEPLHNGEQGNLILFNASNNPDKEVKFGAKGDNGAVAFNSGFVRKLSQEEQNEIVSYPGKLTARNAFIDKAIAEIAANTKDERAKAKAKTEEAEKQSQIDKQEEMRRMEAAEVANQEVMRRRAAEDRAKTLSQRRY